MLTIGLFYPPPLRPFSNVLVDSFHPNLFTIYLVFRCSICLFQIMLFPFGHYDLCHPFLFLIGLYLYLYPINPVHPMPLFLKQVCLFHFDPLFFIIPLNPCCLRFIFKVPIYPFQPIPTSIDPIFPFRLLPTY